MESAKGEGWRLESDWWRKQWMSRPTPKAVRHRGYIYPERFTVRWIRQDDLEVEIDIRVDSEEGPFPMAVTIRGPNGIAGEYRQPIPSMVRVAAAQHTYTEIEPGHLVPAAPGPIPMGKVTVRTDDERLSRIADLYQRALGEGRGVTELIEQTEHVSRATAYGLISAARRAGLIPPSRPGRKRVKNG